MKFPEMRARRSRLGDNIRRMAAETALSADNFIYPLFIVQGKGIREEISSMPGCYHFSADMLKPEMDEIAALGIPCVLLFGAPTEKTVDARTAYKDNGIVQEAVREIKKISPALIVATDVCLCSYTKNGHCGILKGGQIDNDKSAGLIAKTALSHAKAGADIVAPSAMMDGQVAAIRGALLKAGFNDTMIMSYSAKYASAFYGPFREAACSAPQSGDRKSYQMDYKNAIEAEKEALMDIDEGADIVMVKPALPYLDVIYRIKQAVRTPVAAYNVSGEYSMLKTAAKAGLMDGEKAMMEMLYSIKRAGADIIITYFAKEAAALLKSGA